MELILIMNICYHIQLIDFLWQQNLFYPPQKTLRFLNVQLDRRTHAVKHILNMKNFCSNIVYVYFYKEKGDF